jgi:hypothetical protein
MPNLVNLLVEGDQIWDEHERSTIEQVALDVGIAIARDINRVNEQFKRLREMLIAAGEEVQPIVPIEPADAFQNVFGRDRPVKFVRKDEPADGFFWGRTRSRDEIWVYKNAPAFSTSEFKATVSSRPEFSVHELGHAFENVIAAAIGTKRGRNSIPPNMVNRPHGFFQRGRFQQSQDLGRGEIFADMFIGWVYKRWETVDGSPDSKLRQEGIARKRFMDSIMIDLIEVAMDHNKNP